MLHLNEPNNLNVTSIIYHSLRNKPSVKNMNRTDTNTVMQKCFSIKQNVITGLYSVISMMDIFEQKLVDIVFRERAANVYKKAKIDDHIRNAILVFKYDIREAIKTLGVLVRNKEISASAIWYAINETAKNALVNGVRWVDYLTQNSLMDDLLYRGAIPLDQWLLNAGLGFDEEAYKKEIERKKDSESNKTSNRSAVTTMKNFVTTLKGIKSGGNHSKRGKRKFVGNKTISFKSALQDVQAMLSEDLPNTKFDTDYCVFYHHPTATCRHVQNGTTCTKKHTCPSCDLPHKLPNCPDRSRRQS